METEADQLMCRERGRSEEARLSRNGLTWVVCLPPPGGAMVMIKPGLLPRATSWSMALMQPWRSVLMSVAPVTIES